MKSSYSPHQAFTGFSKLDRQARFQRLLEMGALTPEEVAFLESAVHTDLNQLADHFVENAIGCFPLPLGIAANFHMDGRDYVVPMAVEETSVIAAVSNMAKWIRRHGEITTATLGHDVIGQIQIARPQNLPRLQKILEIHAAELIQSANEHVVPNLVARSGGVHALQLRTVPRGDGSMMAVIHVLLNACNAMGANLINQVCEFLRQPIEMLTGETVTMCILSNLADTKLTRAEIVIHDVDPQLGHGIAEAALFAQQDPYRAATHNKGVLNGMDAVTIATGNDWRALEAGVHAYAARSGQYRAISTWQMRGNNLVGTLVAPIMVGTVGGVTRLHPTAQLCLRMLQVQSAEELARVIAAVGLVQNLGALRALTTTGIVKGHMKLHLRNLLLAAGASAEEQFLLQPELQTFLTSNHKVTETDVRQMLQALRQTSEIS